MRTEHSKLLVLCMKEIPDFGLVLSQINLVICFENFENFLIFAILGDHNWQSGAFCCKLYPMFDKQ